MANVFVGFHDQRNSSRILKPPGGDTSDIFGSDLIPDVVPQSSPRQHVVKSRGSSIQDVLRTETVTTTVKEHKTTTSTNGTVTVAENYESNNGENNHHHHHEELAVAPQEQQKQQDVTTTSSPEAAEITYKVEQMKIEERSSKAEVTETDSGGNTKVLLSESNSEGSVEKNSGCKKGSSIGAILNEDELMATKKVKGQPSGQPAQRVPPGGYSSGLW